MPWCPNGPELRKRDNAIPHRRHNSTLHADIGVLTFIFYGGDKNIYLCRVEP
jgi:hypothetical protein